MANVNQTNLGILDALKGKGYTGSDQTGDALDPAQTMSRGGGQGFDDFFRGGHHSGLDRIPDLIKSDPGLRESETATDRDIARGAKAADGMNTILEKAIKATGVAADNDISQDDVRAINEYIRSDARLIEKWTKLHGDDEDGEETGFHLVQNDGASRQMFGENFVNTVADGIYHMGFEIQGDNILNEDGNANASVSDLSDWLTYFYADQSTTGTGLDRIVDSIKADRGLAENTNAGDINGGAAAADQLNQIIVEKLAETGAMADRWITVSDLKAINELIQNDPELLARWTELHGDDEGDEETGFHLVQNDGGSKQIFGENYIDTVADGIYHMGFAIEDGRFLNEDGDQNATVGDVAKWLNHFMLNTKLVSGTDGADRIRDGGGNQQVDAGGGNDVVATGRGADLIDGGAGDDRINGGAGNDYLFGGDGCDVFVFGRGSGHDIIADFELGEDKLSFQGLNAARVQDVKISVVGDDTVATYGGNEVVLAGVNLENVNQADFIV